MLGGDAALFLAGSSSTGIFALEAALKDKRIDLAAWLFLINWYVAPAHGALGLEQIQKLAVENSLELIAQSFQVRAEEAKSLQAQVWANPQALVQLGRLNSGGFQGSTEDYTLTQAIPIGGKVRYRFEVARIGRELAELTLESARLEVQHRAARAAVRAVWLQEIAKHAAERRDRFKLILNYLSSRPLAAPVQRIEANLIRYRIRSLSHLLTESEMSAAQAWKELEYYIGPTNRSIRVPWLKKALPFAIGDLMNKASENSAELKKRQEELKRAEASMQLASALRWPDFAVGFNYRVERVQPENHFGQGLLGLSLPLWDRSQHQRAEAQAHVMRERAELDKSLKRFRVEFEQAWIHADAQAKIVEQFPQQLIKESDRSFIEAELEFRKGRIGAPLLLAADEQCHELVDQSYFAQIGYLESLSQIYFLSGAPLDVSMLESIGEL